ncbi:hypothetical protein [Psychromonas sp. KJ10-2]|uniref:hypothetical protein n=1 Tax=Psychromonas sp. KJ10-2 TaxID=3391822 RepID=UPI0039B58E7A
MGVIYISLIVPFYECYKEDEIGDLIVGFKAAIDMVNDRNEAQEKSNSALESLS